MFKEYVKYRCPYCSTKNVDTVATLPYVRGYILVFEYGTKKFVGCISCVRKKLFRETGKSLIYGWFSPRAFWLNPFLILYGAFRTIILFRNAKAVLRELEKAGIKPSRRSVDIVAVGYCLASSVITADKQIKPEEIDVAIQIGSKLFEGFDEQDFLLVLKKYRTLPEVAGLSKLLGGILMREEKRLVCKYLLAIAKSDGDFAPEEQKLIDLIIKNIGLNPSVIWNETAENTATSDRKGLDFGQGNAKFYEEKLKTARFFMTRMHPEAEERYKMVLAGAAPIMDMDEDQF